MHALLKQLQLSVSNYPLFSMDCWPWAWTCLSTSSGEKPSYGVPGEGRRRWDEAAPFGQSSWVTSALKGPWKRREVEKLFFAHPASLHSCTSVSHAADNSTGFLSNSVAEKLVVAWLLLAASCALLGEWHFASVSQLPSLSRLQKDPVEKS